MLAVWCFTVFAAVGERLSVSGKRERERERLAGDLLLSFCASIFPLCTCKSVISMLVVIFLKWIRGSNRPADSQLQ